MQQMEVEVTAKISNVKKLKDKIKSFARFLKNSHKEDVYYTFNTTKGYPEERFRIRKEGKKYIVNFKIGKSQKHEIAAKEEFEFPIQDIKTFLMFLSEFGFKSFVHKVKDSEVYTYNSTSIEINKVKHLGWFLEIEQLCTKKEVKEAKKKINAIMKKLGIKKSQINNTGYTRMLYEKGLFK